MEPRRKSPESHSRPPGLGSRDIEALKLIEEPGLLVVLALLAEAGGRALSAAEILDVSGLPPDVARSAVAKTVEVGLLAEELPGLGIQAFQRYALTDVGLTVGRIALDIRDMMQDLPPPP